MECDQVFMVLTSGPFPTGDPTDSEVEEHLEQCSDCWRIAEALRPAHDVFEESIPASEGHDLPGYWGDALPARAVMAELQQTAVRTTAAAERKRNSSQLLAHKPRSVAAWRDLLIVAGFVLAIVGVAFLAAWLIRFYR